MDDLLHYLLRDHADDVDAARRKASLAYSTFSDMPEAISFTNLRYNWRMGPDLEPFDVTLRVDA